MVFTEKVDLNRTKAKQRDDLDEEFGLSVRDNEGEAANYGIYYDDTEYDYMQHMRDLGSSNEAVFLEAPTKAKKEKGKMKLEDALQQLDIRSESGVSHASSSTTCCKMLLAITQTTRSSSASFTKTAKPTYATF